MINVHDFTQFCKRKHDSQKRWDGTSYFDNHCVPVAQSTFRYNIYCPEQFIEFVQPRMTDLYCIGLAHDVLEDTDTTYDELKDASSMYIADSVLNLTKGSGVTYTNYIKDLCHNINEHTIMLLIVKQCDLIHNLSSLTGKQQQQRRDKYELALAYIGSKLWSR